MVYFLHGRPFLTSTHSSSDNTGVDIRAIRKLGEVKTKNKFGQYESIYGKLIKKVSKTNN